MAVDALTVPAGWDVAHVVTVADINSIDPGATVEIETSPDFYAVSGFGFSDVISNVPSVAQQLDAAAQAYGSRVYAVILLHQTEFNFLGIQVDRYRWVIVHTQFPALLVLVGIPVVIAIVAVWLQCQGKSPADCGQMVQATAHDASQALCNTFGAACAVQALGTVLILFSIGSIALAGVLFALELGAADKLGLKKPVLPKIPAPVGVQPPRVSVGLGAPSGVGPSVALSTGGRGGGRRRG